MNNKQNDYTLTIGWLYPELMSTYGDRGNIISFVKRSEWRGITAHVQELNVNFTHTQLALCDILFMGGAQDQQQKIVSDDLKKKREIVKDMIEKEIPGLYICGAYQFLGKYYKEADGTKIEGLGILDLYTENPGITHPRLIGTIITETHDLISYTYNSQKSPEHGPQTTINHRQLTIDNLLVGFENHGGRTYLGAHIKPFGKVVKGSGNNGKDYTEGAVYKNSFGTYLHGPLLPKNPHFADYLIKLALEKKYKKEIHLSPLDDTLEWKAHNDVLTKIGVKK